MSIIPKNWATFQHYKNRSPAWIKLHRGLLDDFAYSRLPVASRALAPMLWLLASEYEGGAISLTFEEIAFRFRMSEEELTEAINPLIEAKFFSVNSKMLARRKQSACLEEEREEEKKDTCTFAKAKRTKNDYSEEFETNFWKPYPRTSIMSKQEAWREWMKLGPDQRSASCQALPSYLRHLSQNPTLQAVHACRFLSQNRAEGILEIAAEKPTFDVRKHLM